jgi:RNA polymerase sigma-70 factor (ECF subfamily)
MTPPSAANLDVAGRSLDADLVARCQSGDREAFDRLVIHHQDRVYNTILRFTGDRERSLDLAQKTFLNAFLKIRQFEAKASFGTWLYRIAINLCISESRGRRSEPVSLSRLGGGDEETGFDPPASRGDPVDDIEARETREAVQEAIHSLDEEHRAIVVLRDIEDRSYDEIAEVLDLPKGTVRSRLHRARTDLKAKLERILGTSRGGAASKGC